MPETLQSLSLESAYFYFVRLHDYYVPRSSFRHGLPESSLHGWIKLAILGTGYPLPGGYDELAHNLTK